MNDVMVDLETMDNVASSAIVSIGAVHCDLITGETGSTFYRVIDLKGQQKFGRTLNPKTIYWWLNQGDSARQALLIESKILLEDMCDKFNKWLWSLGPNPETIRLWGNGASFDNAILRHAYRQYGKELNIEYWNDRDMRTIVGFYPRQLQEKWRRSNLRTGYHHNALDDAKYQVKYCSDILKELGVKELY